jgi:hypothetical protein
MGEGWPRLTWITATSTPISTPYRCVTDSLTTGRTAKELGITPEASFFGALTAREEERIDMGDGPVIDLDGDATSDSEDPFQSLIGELLCPPLLRMTEKRQESGSD